jgi:hypothetical protein
MVDDLLCRPDEERVVNMKGFPGKRQQAGNRG